jgi:apolipoprotein N-acyltransferase
LICFEDTVPDLARAYLRKATPEAPVELLVNQSNDGWFNNSVEGRYHLAAAVFRCVETRRPMVRSSNTGPSGLVDSNGKVAAQFEKDGKTQGVEGWLRVRAPLDDRSAPYVVLGDWLPLAGLLLAGSLAAASLVRTALVFRREWRRAQSG